MSMAKLALGAIELPPGIKAGVFRFELLNPAGAVISQHDSAEPSIQLDEWQREQPGDYVIRATRMDSSGAQLAPSVSCSWSIAPREIAQVPISLSVE